MFLCAYAHDDNDIVHASDDNILHDISAVMTTNNFIDSATEIAQVVFVFFTPRSGIITGAKKLGKLVKLPDSLSFLPSCASPSLHGLTLECHILHSSPRYFSRFLRFPSDYRFRHW
jgi:hypothetical protein